MTRSFFWLTFLVLSTLTWKTETAKILAVFPMTSYSHFQLGFRLAKELADRGHEVVAINPFPQKTPIPNYRDVSVEELTDFVGQFNKNLFAMNRMNPLENIKMIFHLGSEITERTLRNENVQKLMKSGEKFDAMIMEHFIDDGLLGLAHHFQIPSVLIGSVGASSFNNYLFANPSPSSYVPNLLADFSKHMNFWQRLKNLFYNILIDVSREMYFIPRQREIVKKYINTDLELETFIYNVSLILTNSHVSVNDAKPHVPNMIEIGGFHVKPEQPLPEDLKKFLDNSKNGVILFSMGSNLKSKDLKPEVRDSILKAFSKLKQNVLWKFEADITDLPKNVKIMKWVPQQDVLRHPNVKAFISHGGLLSTIEAVYFGVPIIGIPVFGDQMANIGSAVANGFAVSVPINDINEEKLSWALDEIINNPKYQQNIKQRSKIMHDQPLKPIDAAVFWVEHVIRHKGAPHLRSAGLDLKWYQREMIDIILFLTLVTIILFLIFYIVIKKLLGLCFRKKLKVTKSKKNK